MTVDAVEALHLLVRGETPPRVDGLLEAAQRHDLVSLLAHARPGDADIAELAERQHVVLERALKDLPLVAASCIGTVWALVRGPVLSETVYLERLQRDVAGLEVLVEPQHTGDVLVGLERVGARLIDRNWRQAHRRRISAVRLALPSGTLVTVRWSLIDDAGARRSMALPELVRRRQRAYLDGLDVFRLTPADALLDVCMHSTLSGGHKLVWIRDIVESMRSVTLSALLTRARPLGVELIVATALMRAAAVVDIPTLQTDGTWSRLMQLTSTAKPPGRSPSRLVAATRVGFSSSSRALLGHRRDDQPAMLMSIDDGWREKYLADVASGRL